MEKSWVNKRGQVFKVLGRSEYEFTAMDFIPEGTDEEYSSAEELKQKYPDKLIWVRPARHEWLVARSATVKIDRLKLIQKAVMDSPNHRVTYDSYNDTEFYHYLLKRFKNGINGFKGEFGYYHVHFINSPVDDHKAVTVERLILR